MSASQDRVKHKLPIDQIERIINSGNMNVLLFASSNYPPKLEGDEWALRRCSYPGFVELFRADSSFELCSQFTTRHVECILRGEIAQLFDKEMKLIELVVPDSAQQCLNDLPLTPIDKNQQPIADETDKEEIKRSQALQVIIFPKEPRRSMFERAFFISPEDAKRKQEQHIHDLEESTGLTGITLL